MDAFFRKLKEMGYEDVRLISIADGRFMTKQQSSKYMLQGSSVLCGRK